MAQEILDHMSKKESTVKWFIFAIIPILNLYFLWKTAENVSGHQKAVDRHDFLEHMKPKDSTAQWFGIYLIPAVLGVLSGASVFLGSFGLVLMGILTLVSVVVGLYALWRAAEVVSGHEKIYEKYEKVDHMDKKESTIKWFVIGIIPIVNLYLVWKMGETISGHERIYE